jgi:hypothetical protein
MTGDRKKSVNIHSRLVNAITLIFLLDSQTDFRMQSNIYKHSPPLSFT